MIFITCGKNKYMARDLSDDSLIYFIRNDVGYIMYHFSSIKNLIKIEIDDSPERKYELIRSVFITSRAALNTFIDDCL